MPVDFAAIYATDLAYVESCWKLCGDGHCCTFGRYKSKFRLIGTPPVQQLPLLPGEHAWLTEQGYLPTFRAHEHRVVEHTFHGRTLRAETLVGKELGCLCTNAFRTTICRLYPFLPVFDLDGQLTGCDLEFGSFELLENLQGLPRVCRIDAIPAAQMSRLLTITRAIAADPVAMFHVGAYRLTLGHARLRLQELAGSQPEPDFFSLYEMALIRRKLLDWPRLDAELDALAGKFEDRYGHSFALD